jgi:hypothetical protein
VEQLYLSRRNLLTLLSKLDRAKAGEVTHRTILKNDTVHPTFPASMGMILVTAVEDEDYYTDRQPGDVSPEDTPETKQ